MTRVLIADDHELFTEGLRVLLENQPGLEVIGEAKDGLEAVRAARDRRPDLILMDLSMPGMNGIEATHQITSELAEVKVLCLSMHSDARFVEAALDAGAAGYLLKENSADELIRAVATVMTGQIFLSPAVAGVLVETFRAQRSRGRTSAFSLLSDREREVLQLVAEGHSDKEIAARLHLSIKTVGSHRRRLMQKLDIRSVAGLTKYAIREGLTSIQS